MDAVLIDTTVKVCLVLLALAVLRPLLPILFGGVLVWVLLKAITGWRRDS